MDNKYLNRSHTAGNEELTPNYGNSNSNSNIEYVDLELPSGTLWATMNVGAKNENDYGDYYMYGKGERKYNSSDEPYAGTENPLALSADTAAQVCGGEWHTPTKDQFQELIDNTTHQWVQHSVEGSDVGVYGMLFTSNFNSATVFFPAGGMINDDSLVEAGTTGFYYSSTPELIGEVDEESENVFVFYIYSSGILLSSDSDGRINGLLIRPVIGEIVENVVEEPTPDEPSVL